MVNITVLHVFHPKNVNFLCNGVPDKSNTCICSVTEKPNDIVSHYVLATYILKNWDTKVLHIRYDAFLCDRDLSVLNKF